MSSLEPAGATATTVALAAALGADKPRLSPRKRTAIVRTVQYVVFAAAVVALAFSANWPQIKAVFFRGDMIVTTLTNTVTVGTGAGVVFRALLLAFLNTLAYSVGAFVIGLLLGTVLALMKLSQVGPYRWVATVYIEIFRGLPALVVLLIFSMLALAFSGLVLPLDPYGTVWAALGLVYAAYMSETIRAGIQAVPKGQVEAARTLGMPAGMATRRIVLPQAFRIITPPLTNDLISLVKDSSLVYILGLTAQGFELTKFGRNLANANANLTPLMMAGLCYLVITVPLGFLVRRMEASAAAKGGSK
ncbi:MAG: amino acid ABC transporter permease [Actinomycetia bacterium]|nr:amino acid ABC transporter permease [Actinomycetes bacterium]